MLQTEQLTKWQLFSLKMTTSTILSEIYVICAFAQLLTTFIFFSVWDQSHVKWDNFENSTHEKRTLILFWGYICLLLFFKCEAWKYKRTTRKSVFIGKLVFCHRAAHLKYKITLKCHLALVIIGFAAYCCVQNNKSLNFLLQVQVCYLEFIAS